MVSCARWFVKPKEEAAIYVSYATSLSPSWKDCRTAGQHRHRAGEDYNLEVGSKWDLIDETPVGERRDLPREKTTRAHRASCRTTRRRSARTPSVQGIELAQAAAITRALRVFGAYTLSTARSIKSNTATEVAGGFRTRPQLVQHLDDLPAASSDHARGGRASSDAASATPLTHGQVTLTGCSTRWPRSRVETSRLRLNLYNLTNDLLLRPAGGGHTSSRRGTFSACQHRVPVLNES